MTILFFKRLTYFILAVSFSFLAFLTPNISSDSKLHFLEQYNPNLANINSLEKASQYINQECSKANLSKYDTLDIVTLTSKFTKERFYHGVSYYEISENWIAYLAGKLLWSHLAAIVEPDDILKYNEGLCSQQTIVFLEILKRKGIKTRWVGLGYKEGPGHFISEIYYQGKWHLYDVNMEPKWNRIINDHKSMDYYLRSPDTLYVAYQGILDKQRFNKIMEKVEYGDVNEFPAKNMLLFHRITKIITYILPFFFMLMIIMTLFKQKVPAKIIKKTSASLKSKKVNSL